MFFNIVWIFILFVCVWIIVLWINSIVLWINSIFSALIFIWIYLEFAFESILCSVIVILV